MQWMVWQSQDLPVCKLQAEYCLQYIFRKKYFLMIDTYITGILLQEELNASPIKSFFPFIITSIPLQNTLAVLAKRKSSFIHQYEIPYIIVLYTCIISGWQYFYCQNRGRAVRIAASTVPSFPQHQVERELQTCVLIPIGASSSNHFSLPRCT